MDMWKIILKIGFPPHCFRKENKGNKNDSFQQNPAVFFSATNSENKVPRRKRQKIIFEQIFIARSATYL